MANWIKYNDARIRKNRIEIKLDDNEYAAFREKYEMSDYRTMTEFILDAVLRGVFVSVETDDYENLIYEINKIGVNINQMARKVNADDLFSAEELRRIMKNISRMEKMVSEAFSDALKRKKG